MKIPFNIPYVSGNEAEYAADAIATRNHCGNKKYGNKVINLLKERYGYKEVFLTPSCTHALEMGAMVAGIGPGDEVILPSYTFSSTVNAVCLRGARPVFCEIETDTMNIDVTKIEALITDKTKMIIGIDYSGIPCDIDAIMEIAKKYDLVVMQDTAQSFHSEYKGRPSGTTPDLATFSFHETKNITCGEGGALIINRPDWVQKAHFIQEKGTDRSLVLKGVKSKYSWVTIGSSYLLSDILSAFLLAQVEDAQKITDLRGKITDAYRNLFEPYVNNNALSVPIVPEYAKINNHAFFVIFVKEDNQQQFMAKLREYNIAAYIGYMPLHSSPQGREYGYKPEDLPLTEDAFSRLVRLPFYTDLANEGLDYTIKHMKLVLKEIYGF
jgi:dTDP-4-amino-4,6-dideoxygalactose transaminase